MIAGMRTLYDKPDFAAYYYRRIQRHHGIALSNLKGTVKEISGKKFNAAFNEICDSLGLFWENSRAERSPFINEIQLTPSASRFTEFNSLVFTKNGLYAKRSGITIPLQLVRIDSAGVVSNMGIFNSNSSALKYDERHERIYWSEYRPDARYELRSFSDVRYLDSLGRRHLLLKGGKYYNPSPSPDGSVVAVNEYPTEGGSRLIIAGADDGNIRAAYSAPSGVQIVESCWVGERLFVSTIEEGGFGVSEIKNGAFTPILEAQPMNIRQLWSLNGEIMFVCDLNGVNELYSLDPASGTLSQRTSTPFGASNFCYDKASDKLYYSSIRTDGRPVFSVSESELMRKETPFAAQKGAFPMADELSEQERQNFPDWKSEPDEVSPTRNYSKAANLFRVHSWLPIFLDYDEIESLSMSSLTSSVGLGGTLFLQNHLGDAYGMAGYHAGYDNGWQHSGHFNFTYAGLYPVFQIKASLNERDAINYSYTVDENGGSFSGFYSGKPLIYAELSSYIPFNFSGGGLNRGLVPKLQFTATNDRYSSESGSGAMSRLTASLRGYIVESTPSSRIYPRLGIGAEIGYSIRPMASNLINPACYLFGYAYLPGLHQTHGLKFTTLYEQRGSNAPLVETLSSTAPRGFSSYTNTALASFPAKLKLTLDYAMPVLPLDWSGLGTIAYVRNFELTPHFDLSVISNSSSSGLLGSEAEHLYSVGADFCVRLGNFFFIPYDTRIGVSYDYNGGSSLYSALTTAGYETGRHSLSLVFSVAF